jgi:hypothetical protein
MDHQSQAPLSWASSGGMLSLAPLPPHSKYTCPVGLSPHHHLVVPRGRLSVCVTVCLTDLTDHTSG